MTSASSSIVSNVGSPASRLTRRVMCRSSISRRSRCGIVSMNCSPVEDAGDVLVVEDLLDAGQAERRAGDDHRLGGAAPAAGP